MGLVMWPKLTFAGIALYVLAAAGWILSAGVVRDSGGVELLNVACDPTRELWRDANADFAEWYALQPNGRAVSVRMSHGGSGSQARSVIDGLPADIVTLALFTDTDQIRKAKLIGDGWEAKLPNRSLPYTSTIVFVVRKGNPKNIRGWADLTRSGIEIVTPNPKTSGNGKWSFLAMWGSQIWNGKSEDDARNYVKQALKNVPVFDLAARGATMRFANQRAGDVHLTWENEALLEVQESNGELELIYPIVTTADGKERRLSVLAEPHVAIVDANVNKKGTREVAEAYTKYLYTDRAQEIIAKNFHRPIKKEILDRHGERFPAIDLERATTLVKSGKWEDVLKTFFVEGAEFDKATK
jgi:sulfate/thiosulfate-binding protein